MATLVADQEVSAIYKIFADPNVKKVEYIYPHVDKIDGINVEIQIISDRGSRTQLYYKVMSNYFEDYSGNDDECQGEDYRVTLFTSKVTKIEGDHTHMTKDDIRRILIDIEIQASKLLFNKRSGIFMTYRRELNKKHISTDICCVCLELTKIKTRCEHYLCLECFQKLSNERRCPVCRECKIILLKKITVL